MHEIVLINVSGRDRPGITVALCEALARHDVTVLDIGQAVIHDELSWGLLVEVPLAAANGPLYKDVLLKAHELGLDVRFSPVSEAGYAKWFAGQGQARHVVTMLGHQLGARHVAAVAGIVAEHHLNIIGIERLSGRINLDTPENERRSAVELTLSGAVSDLTGMRKQLLALNQSMDVDVAIQADDLYRRNRRLVCFDMDSTLIPMEVIDELAREAKVGEQVAAITRRAMNGELDFKESFAARLALLEGLPEQALQAVAARMELTEGAERLVFVLKRLGYRIAIISGGFRWFAERLGKTLAADHVHANVLEVVDGRVTGRVSGPVVDAARKVTLLRSIAAQEGISMAQTIAVGDGANDLPMLASAGLGVAFHAKPAVRAQASHAIATHGLDGLLYLLGVREHELSTLPGS